ncbi:MAG: flagellar filament outer layer protein FlaA, partial [Spirochaetaceae bacterium]|nr:flagellar filament outer layer protein FlaA [Spirochaetaceae bacterium]
RIFILVVVTLLVAGSMFAEQKTLIDFAKLAADISVAEKEGGDPPETPNQNEATFMEFSNEATSNFTARQRLAMKSSLAIGKWDVLLASSSRNVTTKGLSFTKEAKSKGAFADDDGEEKTVMGVRIHFPTEPFSSWAAIKPPFPIPAFEPNGTVDADAGTFTANEDEDGVTTPSRFEGPADDDGNPTGGYGIVKNVGTIKSIAVNVYGLNFPHSLSVILIDAQGVEKTYFMGYLNFEGWGELRWDNPAYVENVRNRELKVDPIYPDNTPYVKFGGFIIQRQANHKGGDFVGYFKDVSLIYDLAVLPTERDIDDESEWHIIQTRDNERSKSELQRLGQYQMQRQLDLERQAQESFIKPQE